MVTDDHGGPPDGSVADPSDDVDALIEDVRRSLDEEYRLPFEVMSNRDIYERELEEIFGRTWVFVGHESEIPQPGDYARRRIGEDQFIFVRDETGDINVFFDACRHRGTQLCRAEEGNASHFRCPFHGWTYSNTGRLVGLPDQSRCYDGVDKSELALKSAPNVDSYEGLVFACLDPDAPTLEEYLGDFTWYLDIHLKAPDAGWEVIGSPHRWTFDANWKIGTESFSGDDYHFFYLHQSGVDAGFTSDIYEADPEANVFGCRTRRHCEADGHQIVLGSIAPEHVADGRPMYSYPDSVKESFSPEGMSDDQWEFFRDGIIHVGTVFPNFALLHQSLSDTTQETGVLTVRKFAPRGPTKMELISWTLAPADASEEDKRTAHDAMMSTFSPTGVVEQDDAVAWEWITDASDSTFVEQNGFKTHYEMGFNGMSETERIDDEFPGPGRIYDTPYTDAYAVSYHETWCDAMTGEYP